MLTLTPISQGFYEHIAKSNEHKEVFLAQAVERLRRPGQTWYGAVQHHQSATQHCFQEGLIGLG